MSMNIPLDDEIVQEYESSFTDDDVQQYRDVLCALADNLEKYDRPWAHTLLDHADNAIERIDAKIAVRDAARREAEVRPVEDFLKLLTAIVGFMVFCSWLNTNKSIV